MKRINQLFIILMCCFSAATLMSCLGNDDNGRGISTEEQLYYQMNMSGSYYGGSGIYANKMYFYNDTISGNNKTDSIMSVAGAFATDSTFMVSGISGRVLAKEIPDEYADLKEAIENAPNQTMRGQYFVNNTNSEYYYILTYPTSITYPELTYGGQTHKNITIAFWGPTLGYFCTSNTYKVVQMSLCMAAIYEDNKKIVDIYNGSSQDVTLSKASLVIRLVR